MVEGSGLTGGGGSGLVTGRVLFERRDSGEWQVGGVLAWLDAEGAVVGVGYPAAKPVLITETDTIELDAIDAGQWGVTTGPGAVLAGLEDTNLRVIQARVAGLVLPGGAPNVAPLGGMMCDYCDPQQPITSCIYHGNPHG
jgi:hypothetical protein